MDEDVLQPIADGDLPSLVQFLHQDMPFSSPFNLQHDILQVCDWIRVQKEWQRRQPDIHVEILCPEGDFTSGVVVCLCDGLLPAGRVYGLVYSGASQVATLGQVLRATRRLPWERLVILRATLERCVLEVTAAAALTNMGKPPKLNYLCLYHLNQERAANTEIYQRDTTVEVRPLSASQVGAVCRLWPHFTEPFLPLVRAMVAHNLTVGVFVGEELVSMALETEYGGLGLLQTDPRHEKRGYGSLALAYLTRHMGRAGVGPHLFVLDTNLLSKKLVTKWGYSFVSKTCTIFFNDLT